jgi:hypothetical protein
MCLPKLKNRCSIIYIWRGLYHSVLKPGPARRVDSGPGRPGPETGPGGGKNPLGSWPGETRSTRRVDPGTGPPGQTQLRPDLFFFILIDVK